MPPHGQSHVWMQTAYNHDLDQSKQKFIAVHVHACRKGMHSKSKRADCETCSQTGRLKTFCRPNMQCERATHCDDCSQPGRRDGRASARLSCYPSPKGGPLSSHLDAGALECGLSCAVSTETVHSRGILTYVRPRFSARTRLPSPKGGPLKSIFFPASWTRAPLDSATL